jgi:hypothetical protein
VLILDGWHIGGGEKDINEAATRRYKRGKERGNTGRGEVDGRGLEIIQVAAVLVVGVDEKAEVSKKENIKGKEGGERYTATKHQNDRCQKDQSYLMNIFLARDVNSQYQNLSLYPLNRNP